MALARKTYRATTSIELDNRYSNTHLKLDLNLIWIWFETWFEFDLKLDLNLIWIWIDWIWCSGHLIWIWFGIWWLDLIWEKKKDWACQGISRSHCERSLRRNKLPAAEIKWWLSAHLSETCCIVAQEEATCSVLISLMELTYLLKDNSAMSRILVL
jgi:hypothetical protein